MGKERVGTFDQFPAVDLAGCDFEGNDMILAERALAMDPKESVTWIKISSYLRFVEELDWDTYRARHLDVESALCSKSFPKPAVRLLMKGNPQR